MIYSITYVDAFNLLEWSLNYNETDYMQAKKDNMQKLFLTSFPCLVVNVMNYSFIETERIIYYMDNYTSLYHPYS
jgi:hypothetical protein